MGCISNPQMVGLLLGFPTLNIYICMYMPSAYFKYIYIYVCMYHIAMENCPFINDKYNDLWNLNIVIFQFATLVITREFSLFFITINHES